MYKLILLAQLAPLPGLPPLEPMPQPRTFIDNQGGMTTVQPQPGGGFTSIDNQGRMTIGTPDGLLIKPPQPRR